MLRFHFHLYKQLSHSCHSLFSSDGVFKSMYTMRYLGGGGVICQWDINPTIRIYKGNTHEVFNNIQKGVQHDKLWKSSNDLKSLKNVTQTVKYLPYTYTFIDQNHKKTWNNLHISAIISIRYRTTTMLTISHSSYCKRFQTKKIFRMMPVYYSSNSGVCFLVDQMFRYHLEATCPKNSQIILVTFRRKVSEENIFNIRRLVKVNARVDFGPGKLKWTAEDVYDSSAYNK